jgi:deoxyribodipyrimidine photo-lyase
MQRDVRTRDNYALEWAAYVASLMKVALRVYYVLPPPPPPTSAANEGGEPPDLDHLPLSERYGAFLLGGLEFVHKELEAVHVPLHVLQPLSSSDVGACVAASLRRHKAQLAVCDFSPLRHHRAWTEWQLATRLDNDDTDGASAGPTTKVPLWQVDAHNVVPAWTIGSRQVGARTLRPKIHKTLPVYLVDNFPDLPTLVGKESVQKDTIPQLPVFDRDSCERFLRLDMSVPAVDWAKPGTDAALEQLQKFSATGLARYATLRNDPNHPAVCSDLSPWINHGHVSFQRIALEVQKLHKKHANGTASFLEEGIVRRELSDNYLFYTPDDYDKLSGAAGWAQETLRVHSVDRREYTYSVQEWEGANTHDDLWNAAQLQLVNEGRMHGFMRMYWAKKILEWSPSPSTALATAQYLNDKYALDGRDPNGFVGVGWSIMGIHDQGWGERPVFGKIRYVALQGSS